MPALDTDDQRALFKLLRGGNYRAAQKRLKEGRAELSTRALGRTEKDTQSNHHLTVADVSPGGLWDWLKGQPDIDWTDEAVRANVGYAFLVRGDQAALAEAVAHLGGWPDLATQGGWLQAAAISNDPGMLTHLLAQTSASGIELLAQHPTWDPYTAAVRNTVFPEEMPRLPTTLAERFALWGDQGILPRPAQKDPKGDYVEAILPELIRKADSVGGPGAFLAAWTLLTGAPFHQDTTQPLDGNFPTLQARAEAKFPEAFRALARQTQLNQAPAPAVSAARRRPRA